MSKHFRQIGMGACLLLICGAYQLTTRAQTAFKTAEIRLAKPGTRFPFEVIESFDAKYPGDTPGHMGRAGGLEDIRPNVALGDPVFRGDTRIGTITGVLWSRAQGSLAIEFDPVPNQRIAVGDTMSLDLNPSPPGKGND